MFRGLSTIMTKKNSAVIILIAGIVFFGMQLLSEITVLQGLSTFYEPFTLTWFKHVYSLMWTGLSIQSFVQISILILFSLLFGLNIIVFVRYLKHYRKLLKVSGVSMSFVGLILGTFGAGCLSCGVLLITPLISLLGLSATTWLVHHGILVSVIGTVLVAYSTHLLLVKLERTEVCEIK